MEQGFCRIAWKKGRLEGHGDWHDDTAENRDILQTLVDFRNDTYGAGSHIIQYNDGQESKKSAQEVIERALKSVRLTLK